jgi:hypothetical protein
MKRSVRPTCISGDRCRWHLRGRLGTCSAGSGPMRYWCAKYNKLLRGAVNEDPLRCAACRREWKEESPK